MMAMSNLFGWDDFNAFLALDHFIENHSEALKRYSASDRCKLYESLIHQLLTDKDFRYEFMSMGGDLEIIVPGEWIEDKKLIEKYDNAEHTFPEYATEKDKEKHKFFRTHRFKPDFTKPFRID